jgi:hypothetical protein
MAGAASVPAVPAVGWIGLEIGAGRARAADEGRAGVRIAIRGESSARAGRPLAAADALNTHLAALAAKRAGATVQRVVHQIRAERGAAWAAEADPATGEAARLEVVGVVAETGDGVPGKTIHSADADVACIACPAARQAVRAVDGEIGADSTAASAEALRAQRAR